MEPLEKKMDMTLDEIIKLNKQHMGKAAGPSKAARAPIMGTAAAQGGTTGMKTGIAGKRQAIQQRKAGKASQGLGVRVAQPSPQKSAPKSLKLGKARTAGVTKVGVAGRGRQLASKILSKARGGRQALAPKQLASRSPGQGSNTQSSPSAPKQLKQGKQSRQQQQQQQQAVMAQQPRKKNKVKVQYSLVPSSTMPQTASVTKTSQSQRMKQQRNAPLGQGGRGKRGGAQQQPAAELPRAPLIMGAAPTGPRSRKRLQQGQREQQQQQLHQPQDAGVRKKRRQPVAAYAQHVYASGYANPEPTAYLQPQPAPTHGRSSRRQRQVQLPPPVQYYAQPLVMVGKAARKAARRPVYLLPRQAQPQPAEQPAPRWQGYLQPQGGGRRHGPPVQLVRIAPEPALLRLGVAHGGMGGAAPPPQPRRPTPLAHTNHTGLPTAAQADVYYEVEETQGGVQGWQPRVAEARHVPLRQVLGLQRRQG
ncbi:hypothetical protein V8C86DRAFT_2840530 [Haematococcus lacustris]